MIIIPQRLFGATAVKIILQDGNKCILSKQLAQPILNREGYISNHVISILISGEQHIRTYDDELLIVKAGEVLFVPRGMYCISDLLPQGGNFQSLLFYFDDDLIHNFLSTIQLREMDRTKVPSHLKFGELPVLQTFANTVLEIYAKHQLNDKRFLDLKILELLHLLNNVSLKKQFSNFLFRLTLPQKRNIKGFMENNYDKPLKIVDYAYLTGRSISSFRRDFKALFGCTPQRWLKDKRMEKALCILNQKEITVTDLAFEIGYDNISYFIKEFKNRFGLSPKQYMLSKHRNFLS
ncbi:helix-turn-helix transcriptional regulator [Aureispira anguillae]|uniref:AraC family transcriptional regulator n=1 Tax=Aureispira anguillae TaxID=2864201 RepID=A0A915YCR4_9BACT|nr:AraC family transcriptional regulator [Aureispira anguillae]BDS10651.1 AraC family transcriptional regulator [Aureispira anguillae]